MKLSMIGLRGIPALSGGVENVVEHLAPLLVELGADVTVYCRKPYCKERPKQFKGVNLIYLPTINTKFLEAPIHSILATLHSLFTKADIITYHAMGNGIWSVIPRLFNKKTVVVMHGIDWQREKWNIIAKTFIKISERLSMLSNKIISVSKKIKRYYKNNYKKHIEFIPNGVEIIKPEKISSLKRFNLKKDNYILFLSRIVPEKGVHFLIKAFKTIETETKLVIAGDATHTEDYLKEVKQLAKDDERIIFTGPLYGKEKYEAFSNAKLFILPSTIEGMPIVLLEAMSFGTPPLVSDITENLDVIQNYGFKFKNKNIKDLKKQLTYLLKNPEKTKQAGKKCKQLIKEKYQWKTIAEEYFKVYKRVLSGK